MELMMTIKEADRLAVMQRVEGQIISLTLATKELGLSYPQIKRIWRRFKREGPKGLISKRRGVPSKNCLCPELKKRALELICSRYRDYGPTLAKEKLEAHAIRLGKETLRQMMIKEQLWRALLNILEICD